jgi:hypothetical protein
MLLDVSPAAHPAAPIGDGLCVSSDGKDGITMTSVHEPIEPRWRELARQASVEKDHEKMLDLIQQVIEKYNEERRRLRRMV